MFSRIRTEKYTDGCSQAERLRAALDGADAVVIGAGSGLSTAAGFTYAGERFRRYFSDFAAKYGFRDMYSGGFYPFPTREEFWAYWSRYILVNRYQDVPEPVYDDLLQLVRGKDYFVLTTNVDHCFQKAGFDKKRLFYTQGDYGLFQCSAPCCQETINNEAAVREMARRQADMRVPTELLPVCPHCGRPLTMNLRCDDTFAEDEGWHAAAERYCREAYPNEADGICGRAEEYYLTFMRDMPDLGENMMAKNMLDWFTILSFYEASGRRMDGEVLLAIKRRAVERMKFLGKLVDGNKHQ